MATNHVYVFAKAQPSPINFLAEIRSAVEKGGKTISQYQVKNVPPESRKDSEFRSYVFRMRVHSLF